MLSDILQAVWVAQCEWWIAESLFLKEGVWMGKKIVILIGPWRILEKLFE